MKKAFLLFGLVLVLVFISLLLFTPFLDGPFGHVPTLENITEIRISLDVSSETDFVISEPEQISELVAIFNVKTKYIHNLQSPVGRILITFIDKNKKTFSFLTGTNVDRQLYFLNNQRDVVGVNVNEIIGFLEQYPELKNVVNNTLT